MDYARCTLDGSQWLAQDFFELDPPSFEGMKRHLVCIACEGDAWFRKSSFGNKIPHFCAHHIEDCDYATNYQVIDQGDGEEGDQPATNPDSGIVINLGLKDGYQVDVAAKPSPEDTPVGLQLGGTIVKGKGINYPAHHSLINILYKLVRSHGSFAKQNTPVHISESKFNLPTVASELFVNFKDIQPYLDNQERIYWGFISDVAATSDGKIWLNAGNKKDGMSVAIVPEIAEQFKEYFRAEKKLSDLDGCHALIVGPCYYASTGKPMIWCTSLEFIVLRRYNFDV